MRGLDRPVGLRVAGLAATVLVAAGAATSGALPGGDPGAGLRGPGSPGAAFWLGFAGWLAGLILLSAVWWRLGTAAGLVPGRRSLGTAAGLVSGRRRLGTAGRLRAVSPRWLLVTGVLWAVPLLLAPPLASRDVYAYACQGELWRAGLDPYTQGAAAGCPWVDAVPALWQDTPTPYGPLAVALSGAAVALARALTGSVDGQLLVAVGLLRLVALVGGVLIAVYGARLARACGVDPSAARWLGLLSPLVAVHLISGAHNDALTAGLVIAALAVAAGSSTPSAPYGSAPIYAPVPERVVRIWVQSKAARAGVLLGLAVAVKVTAIVALPFVVLLAVIARPPARTGTSPRPAGTGTPQPTERATPGARWWAGVAARLAIATLTGAAAFALLSLATGLGLGWVSALGDTGSLVQWTSLPSGLGMAAGYLLRVLGQPDAFDAAVTVARAAGLAAFAVVGAALVARAVQAVRRATVGPLVTGGDEATSRRAVVGAAGAALAASVLLAPVFYPWYAIAPLAVLAAATTSARARCWLAGVAIALTFLVLPNGLGLAVLTKLPGALLDVALVVAAVALAARHRSRRGSVHGPSIEDLPPSTSGISPR